MKKTVAIIGATGHTGSLIALGLSTAGYRVLLTDDVEEPLLYVKLNLLESRIKIEVAEPDIDIVLSWKEASWEADIVILAIAHAAEADVARTIKDVVTGKIVVRLPGLVADSRNGSGSVSTPPAAIATTQLLPHSKIVTVSDALFLVGAAADEQDGRSLDVQVTGNDNKAVETVAQMFRDVGYHPHVGAAVDDSAEAYASIIT